jgi:hypothetical protein
MATKLGDGVVARLRRRKAWGALKKGMRSRVLVESLGRRTGAQTLYSCREAQGVLVENALQEIDVTATPTRWENEQG